MRILNYRKESLLILPLGLCLAAPSAFAEEQGWSFKLGLGAEYEAAYVGSDEYSTEAGFVLGAAYTTAKNVTWFAGTDGIGVEFEPFEATKVKLSFEYEFGRDNADDPILTGFKEVEDTVEFQAIIIRELGDFEIGLGFQQDVRNRGKGFVGFVGAGYEKYLTDRLSWNANFDVSFANSTHMNTEVGITAADATASGLSQYKASGGYKGASFGVGLDYALTDSTVLFANASIETYGSSISDSPLVRDHGSSTTQEASLGILFNF